MTATFKGSNAESCIEKCAEALAAHGRRSRSQAYMYDEDALKCLTADMLLRQPGEHVDKAFTQHLGAVPSALRRLSDDQYAIIEVCYGLRGYQPVGISEAVYVFSIGDSQFASRFSREAEEYCLRLKAEALARLWACSLIS